MITTLKIPVQALPATSPVWVRGMMAGALVAGVWALSVAMSPAQARDNVYWSIGVDSPGVQLGISNAPPVYVQRPRPVYVQPAPVVVYPGYGQGYRPDYGPGYGHGSRYERPRYVAPAQVYHQQPPRVIYVHPYGAPIGRDYDHRGHRNEDRGYGRGHDRDRGHNRYRYRD
ncbi:MAG: hypothetical protein WEK74_13410 [Hydrogenophaga sp.]